MSNKIKNLEFIKKYVRKKLENESSGHDYLHALRVESNAMEISKKLDVDKNIISAACYVHDLIDEKLEIQYTSSEKVICDTLRLAGFSKEEIEQIIYIINNISYRKHQILDSLEGKIVQDADRLDALGAIGIARTFAFGGTKERKIYSLDENDKQNSIAHFYEKLLKLSDLMNTEAGKKEAVRRTLYMQDFLKEFYKEIN